MLLPIEAFLLEHNEWPTVPEQGHARVVALAGDTEDFHAVAVAAQKDDLTTGTPRAFLIMAPDATTARNPSSSNEAASKPFG